MSNFQVFFTQPAVVHLGWTLLHFLWQGSAGGRIVRGSSRPDQPVDDCSCALRFSVFQPRGHGIRSHSHVWIAGFR
jgi:hypothetical protein